MKYRARSARKIKMLDATSVAICYYVIKKNSIDSPVINNIVREVKQKKN